MFLGSGTKSIDLTLQMKMKIILKTDLDIHADESTSDFSIWCEENSDDLDMEKPTTIFPDTNSWWESGATTITISPSISSTNSDVHLVILHTAAMSQSYLFFL